MTFEEIVDQALAMLQRRGRVAYRTLRRQFQLDEDSLEDLKTEIIKAQRLAVDEDGEVLVWIGPTQFHLSSGSMKCVVTWRTDGRRIRSLEDVQGKSLFTSWVALGHEQALPVEESDRVLGYRLAYVRLSKARQNILDAGGE